MFTSQIKIVKGLGSAKNGTSHWWQQRITSIFMIPLLIWFFWSLIIVSSEDREFIMGFFYKPYNVVPMILLVLISFYHAKLGLSVVIEDYVSCMKLRYFLLIFLNGFVILTVLSVLIALVYFLLQYHMLG